MKSRIRADDDVIAVHGQKLRAGCFVSVDQYPVPCKVVGEQVCLDQAGEPRDHGEGQLVEVFGLIRPRRGHVQCTGKRATRTKDRRVYEAHTDVGRLEMLITMDDEGPFLLDAGPCSVGAFGCFTPVAARLQSLLSKGICVGERRAPRQNAGIPVGQKNSGPEVCDQLLELGQAGFGELHQSLGGFLVRPEPGGVRRITPRRGVGIETMQIDAAPPRHRDLRVRGRRSIRYDGENPVRVVYCRPIPPADHSSPATHQKCLNRVNLGIGRLRKRARTCPIRSARAAFPFRRRRVYRISRRQPGWPSLDWRSWRAPPRRGRIQRARDAPEGYRCWPVVRP